MGARAFRVTRTAGLLLAATAAIGAGQFRGTTELVPVYATVLDREGRLVPDLQKEDFVILDNGKEQRVAFFSNQVMPFTVVVMLDRSGSMFPHQDAIREAASAFVQQLLPADRARIGSFGNRITIVPQDFTNDRAVLLEILGRRAGDEGASPVWFSIDQSITALYGLEGRRVVLIMSDGHDQPAANQRRATFKDVADRVRRANVLVYAIGFTHLDLSSGRPKVEKPNEELRRLAGISGGGYFEMKTTAELTQMFTRVAEELHRQYWLAFEPPVADGKLHEIEVRVKRPGLTARARQSYLAPAR